MLPPSPTGTGMAAATEARWPDVVSARLIGPRGEVAAMASELRAAHRDARVSREYPARGGDVRVYVEIDDRSEYGDREIPPGNGRIRNG